MKKSKIKSKMFSFIEDKESKGSKDQQPVFREIAGLAGQFNT